MNAPYLILGLLCGLAIGFAFGAQYGQRLRKARDPINRMVGWSDARYITELEDVVRVIRSDREKLAQVRRTVADCAGGSPCTGCTEKRRCAAMGCVRMAEACDPPMGKPTPARGVGEVRSQVSGGQVLLDGNEP
jgi:hypothetical protein